MSAVCRPYTVVTADSGSTVFRVYRKTIRAYQKMFCSGRVIFGYHRDIRKVCNRKLPKPAVAFCLWFTATSALFVLLREISTGAYGKQGMSTSVA